MDGFPFEIDYSVRVADINYGGHVANSAVLNFFQDARIAFLNHLGGFGEMDIGGCGIILPEAHVYYRQEMLLGDQLKIGVRVEELKRSSVTLKYRIERHGTVTAEGETALVGYDYVAKKVCRLPLAFKELISSTR